MKKIILTAIVLFTGLSFAMSQTTKAPEQKPESKLEFVQKIADLGEIPQGVPATATYEFVNNSDKPVVITNVKTSCGCTGKEYSKEPIKPGEKSQVKATYNAASLGTFQKTVTVTTNEGTDPIVLRIKGKVINKTE